MLLDVVIVMRVRSPRDDQGGRLGMLSVYLTAA